MKRCLYCHQVAEDEDRECAGCGARDWIYDEEEIEQIEKEVIIVDKPYDGGRFLRVTTDYDNYRDEPPPVIPEDPRIREYGYIIRDLSNNCDLYREQIELLEHQKASLFVLAMIFEITTILLGYIFYATH